MAAFSNSNPVILIVEDEALIRLQAVEWLREAGFRIFQAVTGEEAISFLRSEETIDILFTDIRLGGESDGWDVAEAFRQRYPTLPVVYCSGYMTKPPRIVGGGLFLTKPYRSQQIVGACRMLLGNPSSSIASQKSSA